LSTSVEAISIHNQVEVVVVGGGGAAAAAADMVVAIKSPINSIESTKPINSTKIVVVGM
jgi:succinate dehydrogenase/fumarate reductase flavoprotein subunit